MAMPFHNWETHNVVDGKEYDLDFRKVLTIRHQVLEEQITPDYKLLGCDDLEEYKMLMKWLNTERWVDVSEEVLREKLDPEEYDKYVAEQHKNRSFDMLKDWDAYYADFLRLYNIDLISIRYLDWFRFTWLLAGLFNVEDTLTHKRAYARGVDLNKLDKSLRAPIKQQRNLYSLEPITINNPFRKETTDGN